MHLAAYILYYHSHGGTDKATGVGCALVRNGNVWRVLFASCMQCDSAGSSTPKANTPNSEILLSVFLCVLWALRYGLRQGFYDHDLCPIAGISLAEFLHAALAPKLQAGLSVLDCCDDCC